MTPTMYSACCDKTPMNSISRSNFTKMKNTYDNSRYFAASSELRRDSKRCLSASENLLYLVLRSVSFSSSWGRLYDKSVFNWFSVMFANDSSELCESKCLVLLMTSQLSRRAPFFIVDTLIFDEWSTTSATKIVLNIYI